jgi:hypothetical protein
MSTLMNPPALCASIFLPKRSKSGKKSAEIEEWSSETNPGLVVHHKRDGSNLCAYDKPPHLMNKLSASPTEELLTFDGSQSRGGPCGPFAHYLVSGIAAIYNNFGSPLDMRISISKRRKPMI